jgi:hypothetical protein
MPAPDRNVQSSGDAGEPNARLVGQSCTVSSKEPASPVCDACGEPVKPLDQHCRKCGAWAAARPCKKCRKPVEPGDHFCGACGRKVDRDDSADRDERPWSSSAAVLITLLALAVVAIVGLAVILALALHGQDHDGNRLLRNRDQIKIVVVVPSASPGQTCCGPCPCGLLTPPKVLG